jgi:AcrR family transcriptional regulator
MSTEHDDKGPASSIVRSQELLWRRQEPKTRGPKPGLSLDQIVDTAIAVADAEGIAGLSMRRVARELGAGTMSLYRYVPGKEELLSLMLDRVSDPSKEIEQATGEDWRSVVETAARGSWKLYLDHPWLLHVNWARPVFGPNTLAGVEFLIAGLDGIGLTDVERIMVLTAVDGFVVGTARSFIHYSNAAEETGVSEEEFWEVQLPYLEQAMASGAYPAMASLSEDAFSGGWEETFEFGLNRILDGLEKLITERSRD